MKRCQAGRSIAALALLIAATGLARAQGAGDPAARVAALKAALQENQGRLRQYEWIETTIISLKGEEKARKQQRCYYSADGKVQKVAVGDAAPAPAPAPQPSGGRRGGRIKERVVENKKEDMRDYMERAVALIHQYVPPNPALIQQAKDAGHLNLRPVGDGVVQLQFTSYLQPKDSFAIDVDGVANRLRAIALSTYLEKPDEPVTLNVRFATLDDGTSYAAQTTLDAPEKNIRVVVENSGYRPVGR
jgi:hypothetical protein